MQKKITKTKTKTKPKTMKTIKKADLRKIAGGGPMFAGISLK